MAGDNSSIMKKVISLWVCLLFFISTGCSDKTSNKKKINKIINSDIVEKFDGVTIAPYRSDYVKNLRLYSDQYKTIIIKRGFFNNLHFINRKEEETPDLDYLQSIFNEFNELGIISFHSNKYFVEIGTVFSDSTYEEVKAHNTGYYDLEFHAPKMVGTGHNYDGNKWLNVPYRYVLVCFLMKNDQQRDSIAQKAFFQIKLTKLDSNWYYYRTHSSFNINEL